jgi:hypothetical protein
MIDYEKLKLAHELAYKSESYYFDISLGMDNGYITLNDANKHHQQIYSTECLDDLIAKLQELTQDKPNPKYKDMAWFIKDGEIKGFSPSLYEDGKYYFGPLLGWLDKKELYPSKQELIESQITYWCAQLDMKDEIQYWAKRPQEFQPPFEGEIKGFSSCCSVHTGTAEKCFDSQANQYEVDLHRCQHESDGWYYHGNGFGSKHKFAGAHHKCKYCGEFYK